MRSTVSLVLLLSASACTLDGNPPGRVTIDDPTSEVSSEDLDALYDEVDALRDELEQKLKELEERLASEDTASDPSCRYPTPIVFQAGASVFLRLCAEEATATLLRMDQQIYDAMEMLPIGDDLWYLETIEPAAFFRITARSTTGDTVCVPGPNCGGALGYDDLPYGY